MRNSCRLGSSSLKGSSEGAEKREKEFRQKREKNPCKIEKTYYN